MKISLRATICKSGAACAMGVLDFLYISICCGLIWKNNIHIFFSKKNENSRIWSNSKILPKTSKLGQLTFLSPLTHYCIDLSSWIGHHMIKRYTENHFPGNQSKRVKSKWYTTQGKCTIFRNCHFKTFTLNPFLTTKLGKTTLQRWSNTR